MANKFVKRIVEITDYQTHILEELRKGVVLTTSDAGRINAMAISWGMLGVEWNKPIFITHCRKSECKRMRYRRAAAYTRM